MFFKDIETWTLSKVRKYWALFNILYLLAMLVAPIIIIAGQYGWFQTSEKIKLLSGWCLIILVICVVIGLFALRKVLRKLPDETIKQQKLKYTIEMLEALILPFLVIFVSYQFKLALEQAFNTVVYCSICWIAGVLIDGLFVKYLDKELFYQQELDHQSALEKRKHRFR